MVKRISITLDDEVYKEFEEKRKKSYPLMNRSKIIEQLIQKFNGKEVYFK